MTNWHLGSGLLNIVHGFSYIFVDYHSTPGGWLSSSSGHFPGWWRTVSSDFLHPEDAGEYKASVILRDDDHLIWSALPSCVTQTVWQSGGGCEEETRQDTSKVVVQTIECCPKAGCSWCQTGANPFNWGLGGGFPEPHEHAGTVQPHAWQLQLLEFRRCLRAKKTS